MKSSGIGHHLRLKLKSEIARRFGHISCEIIISLNNYEISEKIGLFASILKNQEVFRRSVVGKHYEKT